VIPDEFNRLLRKEDSGIMDKIGPFLVSPPAEILASEEPSETDKLKLVGKTHDAFVNNPGYDAVVLYTSSNETDTIRAIRLFRAAALNFAGDDTIRFGVINVTINSATFPMMPLLPHIEIWPVVNKSDHRTFYGRHYRDGLERFIQKYGSPKRKMAVPPTPRNEEMFEALKIFSVIDALTGEGHRKANERLLELQGPLAILQQIFSLN
jgi:hypothetical protein